MGIFTSPKLILPFQIARAIRNYFAARAAIARPVLCHVEGSRVPSRSFMRSWRRLWSQCNGSATEIIRDSSTPLGMTRNGCMVIWSAAIRQLPDHFLKRGHVRALQNYAASSSSCREMQRNSKRRISVSSIKLFGHEAPAVMPITAGALGNQKCETTSRFSCRL